METELCKECNGIGLPLDSMGNQQRCQTCDDTGFKQWRPKHNCKLKDNGAAMRAAIKVAGKQTVIRRRYNGTCIERFTNRPDLFWF